MSKPTARYDTIGVGYDSTRKADPYLVQRMHDLLTSGMKGRRFLDVGCGSGNYTVALNNMGLSFVGIDPSEEMLQKARIKSSNVEWISGSAENIPQNDSTYDGVLVSLSIHHWPDLNQGLAEISRVLKPGGRLVLFTTLPEQTKGYWLYHYFPKMMDDSIDILPTINSIRSASDRAALNIVEQEEYFVQPNLQDHFLYCGKHNPEKYLDEAIRRGISSFSLLANQPEVESGLKMLKEDIDSGKINQVIEDFQNNLGDYLFIVAEKSGF